MLYLNIPGLRKSPGKFFMGFWKILGKSWIFVRKSVGTLYFSVRVCYYCEAGFELL